MKALSPKLLINALFQRQGWQGNNNKVLEQSEEQRRVLHGQQRSRNAEAQAQLPAYLGFKT